MTNLHGQATIKLSSLVERLARPTTKEPMKTKSKFHQAAVIADKFKAIDAQEQEARTVLTDRFISRRKDLIATYSDDPELSRMVSSLLESEQSEATVLPDMEGS